MGQRSREARAEELTTRDDWELERWSGGWPAVYPDDQMEKPNGKTEEYRRMAADCIEVAQRMSLKDDRDRMLEMAQRWLDLAQQQAETLSR
jgi:adenylate kinase family enzyme